MDNSHGARFAALAQAAYLDIVLPKTDVGLEELMHHGFQSPVELSRIPARRNLFFDEQAIVLLVLRTTKSEDELRDTLCWLEFVLSAHATDAVPQGGGNAASASGKHDLSSHTFSATDFIAIFAVEDKTYAIWKQRLHLPRPRASLQRPAIYFTASLSLSRETNAIMHKRTNDYLQSFEPLPENVLEPLRFDHAFRQSNIYLPESRITKVAPKAPHLQHTIKPIRGATKRAFPAVPAVFSKISYSSLPNAMLATMHLETSQIIAGTVTFDAVEVCVSETNVSHLTTVDLPFETRGGDETTFIYQFSSSKASAPEARLRPVNVKILAHAVLDQGSQVALNISWQSHVDLSQTLWKPAYRWSRPLASGHHRGISAQSGGAKISLEAAARANDDESGVSFNITGPSHGVLGQNFKLEVQCSNFSNRSRRFALMMLQPRKAKTILQPEAAGTVDTDLVARIFNAPPLEKTRSLGVHYLTPEVRIGPLPSGACFETYMQFRATKTGVLALGVLRILDLDTRQIVDVRELPDVVALAAAD